MSAGLSKAALLFILRQSTPGEECGTEAPDGLSGSRTVKRTIG